jgi:hypothetical protein
VYLITRQDNHKVDGTFMPHPDYLIKNCSAAGERACPKLWSKLKPAFSDMVRHCDRCNKKVYLCETDEQVKFYSSVKFCIAVAASEPMDKVVESPPFKFGLTTGTEATGTDRDIMTESSRHLPNVWHRVQPPRPPGELQSDDIPPFLRKAHHSLAVEEIPAFMRLQSSKSHL